MSSLESRYEDVAVWQAKMETELHFIRQELTQISGILEGMRRDIGGLKVRTAVLAAMWGFFASLFGRFIHFGHG